MNYHEVPDDVIMEFYVQANILRSQGGIRQTIKAAYMTIWLDDFDSIVNSIWMKQGIIHCHPADTDDDEAATVARGDQQWRHGIHILSGQASMDAAAHAANINRVTDGH
ncbi:Os04g0346301 [Oryza sativa Japonica Group]|uniref:Os04g0346301 protein n=1 Tax=Oryza sativa subsp. japonica TaxID=39947 RepID=A0A0P0W905_ORYSJ|nr:Os04g0346301 [Oryza sativa Japonica Group]